MISFFTSLRLLTLKQYEFHHSAKADCIKLSEKYHCTQGQYIEAKSEYFLSRCSECEHQSKVKKNLKYVDKLLRCYRCLKISWDVNQPLILFFSNGSVATLEFNEENNTLLNVDIDDNLCGKILPSHLVDVLVCKDCIYVTYAEPKLTLICINQDSPSLLAKIFGRKRGKLVGFEPKIFHFDLYVHSTKSLERKLSLNTEGNLLLVWWRNSTYDVWPWTPVAYLTDRVNMLIYSTDGRSIELLCSIKVQDELLHACFSRQYSNHLFSLEELKKEGEIIVNVCSHEITEDQCQLVHTAKLPVRGNLVTFDWGFTEDKLLAADADGHLLIYDANKRSTIVTNLEFLPRHISWHPQDCIAVIVSKTNQILCFDAALNMINFRLCYKTNSEIKGLDLNSFFCQQFVVQRVLWQKSAFNDTCVVMLNADLSTFFIIRFSFGCITKYNVTTLEIISQYLKSNSLDKAILMLRSLDWCHKGDIKFQCLSKIANFLLRKPLNIQTQSALELALGTFYDWLEVLPTRVIKMYDSRMHHLARRFFHHLLRYHKFRKAFLLAVDLDSQDLFLDLYHVAKKEDQGILAAVALRKAEEFDESSSSCSESCQSESCSDSAASSYNESLPSKDGEDVHWSQGSGKLPISTGAKIVQASLDSEGSNPNNLKHQHHPISGVQAGNSSRQSDFTTVHLYEKELSPKSSLLYNPLPEHSAGNTSLYNKEPSILSDSSNVMNSRNKACDTNSSSIKNVRESSIIEDENEEVEGTQIKFAHLGII